MFEFNFSIDTNTHLDNPVDDNSKAPDRVAKDRSQSVISRCKARGGARRVALMFGDELQKEYESLTEAFNSDKGIKSYGIDVRDYNMLCRLFREGRSLPVAQNGLTDKPFRLVDVPDIADGNVASKTTSKTSRRRQVKRTVVFPTSMTLEQEATRWRNGKIGTNNVAEALNILGYTTITGKRWTSDSVYHVFKKNHL